MPIAGGLIIALQVFCCVHVIRSGRSPYWLWVLILSWSWLVGQVGSGVKVYSGC